MGQSQARLVPTRVLSKIVTTYGAVPGRRPEISPSTVGIGMVTSAFRQREVSQVQVEFEYKCEPWRLVEIGMCFRMPLMRLRLIW